MKNKYYTPELDEFYVGFECETNDDGDWEYYRVKKYTSLLELDKLLKLNGIRVKYLDKSDIESLGWELDEYISDTCITFKNKQGCFLAFHTNETYIEISREAPYDIGASLFIKNKSELIKLMKQIGIK